MNRDRRAGLALGLVLVTFGLLLVWSHYGWQPVRYLDDHSLHTLHHYAAEHPAFVAAMKVVSTIGSWSTYSVLFAGTTTWLLLKRQPRPALFVAVTPLTSSWLNDLAKTVVDRPRPQLPDPVAHAGGLSFPSGHAQSAMVAVLVLLVVALPARHQRSRRVTLVAAAGFVLVVGFSRVALGVHYVSDVLAGYALGLAWVMVGTMTLLPGGQPRTGAWLLWREPPRRG